MTKIDKTKPVLVTGATGYVASWLIKKLLDEGLTVHAAVRNPDNKEKVGHLDEIAKKSSGKIEYFKSDLLINGSYAEAMKGCELVYHTASPFTSKIKDPQTDLVDPALLGTRNVLEQANETESVKRVVLTSSCAAIYGDNIDIQKTPKGELSEEVWNTTSSLKHQAYSYSKTLAEKEAWEMVKKQKRWDLVVINPSLVIGPALNPHAVTSESFTIFKQLGDGSMKTGAPEFGIGIVDVRDLAFAHIKAGFKPQAKGRHIVSGHNTSFLSMAKTIIPEYGSEYPLPSKKLPKALVWLIGPILSKSLNRKIISRNVGYPFKADNSKSKKELGMNYRPLKDSMKDTFQQMIDNKVF